MVEIQRSMGYHKGIGINCDGSMKNKRGGISLMWSKDVCINLLSFLQHHINIMVVNEENQQQWH